MEDWILIVIAIVVAAAVVAVFAAVAKTSRRKVRVRQAGEIGEAAVSSVLRQCDSGNAIVIDDYMTIEEGASRQIDHICICSNGVFVIETKNYSGTVYGNDNMTLWQYYMNGKEFEFYSPVKQNITHMYCIKNLLPKNVPVFHYEVFAGGDISHVTSQSVTDIFGIKQAIDEHKSSRTLSEEEKFNLSQLIAAARADEISDEYHAAEVKFKQSLVKDNICPHCKVRLEKRLDAKGEYYACPKCSFTKR